MAAQFAFAQCAGEIATLTEPVTAQMAQPKHLMVAAAEVAEEVQPVTVKVQAAKKKRAVDKKPSAVAAAEPKTLAEPTSPPLQGKPEILRELSDIFQFEVIAVCKTVGRTGKKSMEYSIRTECGRVHIGPVSNILKQKAFRNIIADKISRVVPEQKPARSWELIAEKILQASVKMRHRATKAQPSE